MASACTAGKSKHESSKANEAAKQSLRGTCCAFASRRNLGNRTAALFETGPNLYFINTLSDSIVRRWPWQGRQRTLTNPNRSATWMKDLLVTHGVTIPALQAAEDNRRHDGQYPKRYERLMNALDHVRWS